LAFFFFLPREKFRSWWYLIEGFEFEEDRIRQEIRRLDAKRVFLQLPEGLKPNAPKIAQEIAKAGAVAIISADPCYGACDIALAEAEFLGIDLIVHFGHSRMLKHEKIPTIFVEARSVISVVPAVSKSIQMLKDWHSIGLTLSIQHIQYLDEARAILLHEGKEVVIGNKGILAYAGQVTGCNYSNARSIASEVDAFLFVGGGRFHALGVALATNKPTIVADPYENQAYSVSSEAKKILKQRWGCIQEAKNAKTYGILVSVKPGQSRLESAINMKAKLERKGFTAYLMVSREITPDILLDFPSIDAYINTACPRISLDNAQRFRKPVLSISEFSVVSGELSWENLLTDGLFER
jgi:2-(3-amino-3-carboxypropyl)histidine synthase